MLAGVFLEVLGWFATKASEPSLLCYLTHTWENMKRLIHTCAASESPQVMWLLDQIK